MTFRLKLYEALIRFKESKYLWANDMLRNFNNSSTRNSNVVVEVELIHSKFV